MDMQKLVDILNDYAYRYYTLDDPSVSDAEYDELYDKLLKMESEAGLVLDDSPTRRVGGKILTGFNKHRHISELWSLDKIQSQQGLCDWMKRTDKLAEINGLRKPEYSLEYKFDGLTVNLTYENGLLVCGATRGDGVTGEDVTEAVKTIKTIPLKIPYKGRIEVQGEAIMELSALEEYNRTAPEPLKNARNGAAGAIRNLDIKETAKRNLNVFMYNVGYIDGEQFSTHSEMIEFLKNNRFRVSDYELMFSDLNGIMAAVKDVETSGRDKLDFLIDGMVVKITDINTRNILGYTEKFPRWAVAYKFPAIEKTTYVKNIIWDVGRSGKLTPVAELEDVDIGGVTVKRATLNNYEDIVRKNVSIGSRVFVRRSNDVIPEILGASPDQDRTLIPAIKPVTCPSCGTRLESIGPNLFCTNAFDCRPQLLSRMEHFVSRDAMNIEGLSEKTIETVFHSLNIVNIADIYGITVEQLEHLEGFKKRKSENIVRAIELSKRPELSNFITALGIPNVGKKTAKDIAAHYISFDRFLTATREELMTIKEIGSVVADSVIDYINSPHYSDIIQKLLLYGVEPRDYVPAAGNVLAGKSFVLTGTLSRYKRADAQKIIEEMGGTVVSSVSSHTDYVLCGENPGSKIEKAQALGVRIISENDFISILNL